MIANVSTLVRGPHLRGIRPYLPAGRIARRLQAGPRAYYRRWATSTRTGGCSTRRWAGCRYAMPCSLPRAEPPCRFALPCRTSKKILPGLAWPALPFQPSCERRREDHEAHCIAHHVCAMAAAQFYLTAKKIPADLSFKIRKHFKQQLLSRRAMDECEILHARAHAHARTPARTGMRAGLISCRICRCR